LVAKKLLNRFLFTASDHYVTKIFNNAREKHENFALFSNKLKIHSLSDDISRRRKKTQKEIIETKCQIIILLP
jgi:hypothetical protein